MRRRACGHVGLCALLVVAVADCRRRQYFLLLLPPCSFCPLLVACSPLPARSQSRASDTGMTARMTAAMAIATAKAAAAAGYGNGHGHDERSRWRVTVDQVDVCHTAELSPAAQLAPVSQKPRLVCALSRPTGCPVQLHSEPSSYEQVHICACLCACLRGSAWNLRQLQPARSCAEGNASRDAGAMPGSRIQGLFQIVAQRISTEKRKKTQLFFDFAVLRWHREKNLWSWGGGLFGKFGGHGPRPKILDLENVHGGPGLGAKTFDSEKRRGPRGPQAP